MLRDKRNRLDARNALGWWSVFKWAIDIGMLICPVVLWFWHFFKIAMDTPLVLLWLVGKVRHIRERRK